MQLMPDSPLRQAALEVESHVGAEGWDQPPRLFALVPTADLIAKEPGLADQLSDDPASMTPVEQELPADRELEDLLTEIVWPDAVTGCAAVVERIMLPPEAEESLPDDPDELLAVVAAHPDRREVRLVAAVVRDGARAQRRTRQRTPRCRAAGGARPRAGPDRTPPPHSGIESCHPVTRSHVSDIFGTPRPRREPRRGPDRRQRVLVPTLITLAVLLFLGSIFTSVWTDRLWFKSVGYSDVFRSVLFTRVALFLILGLIFGLFVIGNLYIAFRTRPDAAPMRRDDPAYRYRLALTPLLRPVAIGLGLVLTGFAGSVAAAHWDTYKKWRHSTSFGIKDAQFHKDASFYVFEYPWWRFLASYSFALIVITVLAVLFLNYVYGGIRIAGRGPKLTRAAQVHLSVLVGIGVLLKAVSYYLDRFGQVIATGGLVDGVTYTDAHARIPAKNILIGVAIVCALLFFAAIFIRSWALPAIGLGLLALTSILIGAIWPAVMQGFQVKPSEPDKEAPYIARNIEATREAYGVS